MSLVCLLFAGFVACIRSGIAQASSGCSGVNEVLYPPPDLVLALNIDDYLSVSFCSNVPNPSDDQADWNYSYTVGNCMLSAPVPMPLLTQLVTSDSAYALRPFYNPDSLAECLGRNCTCMLGIQDWDDSSIVVWGGNVTLIGTTGIFVRCAASDTLTQPGSLFSPSASAAISSSSLPLPPITSSTVISSMASTSASTVVSTITSASAT